MMNRCYAGHQSRRRQPGGITFIPGKHRSNAPGRIRFTHPPHPSDGSLGLSTLYLPNQRGSKRVNAFVNLITWLTAYPHATQLTRYAAEFAAL